MNNQKIFSKANELYELVRHDPTINPHEAIEALGLAIYMIVRSQLEATGDAAQWPIAFAGIVNWLAENESSFALTKVDLQ